MIVPDELPKRLDHVFLLATPVHMLTKLHWEIYSLRKALSEKPEHITHTHIAAYCAFNCAVTAWHLADWVWKASSEDRRADILRSLSVSATGCDKKDFSNFQTALRRRRRALHVCRQLATGSKHMTVTKYPDPNVRADTRSETEYARAGEMRIGDPLVVHRYRLVVSDKGVERAAVDVFADAFQYWEWFLREWGHLSEDDKLALAALFSRQ
jgi:hypothetical protein